MRSEGALRKTTMQCMCNAMQGSLASLRFASLHFASLRSAGITEGSLKKIKKEMDKIIKQNLPITREEVTREEARRRISTLNEPFKLEILDSIKTEPITIYHTGEPGSSNHWWDLCAGPHVSSTGDLPKKAIELQSVAGAYWRGDSSREMLTRVYGTAWEDPSQLKQFKIMREEAKKRDHRKLGQVCRALLPCL